MLVASQRIAQHGHTLSASVLVFQRAIGSGRNGESCGGIASRSVHHRTNNTMERPIDKMIREAMERGEFDNLPGKGKPLTHLDDYFSAPAELRLGFNVLRNANTPPYEVEMMNEIVALKKELQATTTTERKQELRRTIMNKELELRMRLERIPKSR